MSADKQCLDKVAEVWGTCKAKFVIFYQPTRRCIIISFFLNWTLLIFPLLPPSPQTILFPALMKLFEGLHRLPIREDTLWEKDHCHWKWLWLSGASCHKLNWARDNKLLLWAVTEDVCGISFLRGSHRDADSCAAFLLWLSGAPAFGAVILQHERQTWDALARGFQAVG